MISNTHLEAIKSILFNHLKPIDASAFIFGSWAMGENRTFSDIDIGIESKEELPPLLIEDLKEAFENSELPYKVDVVDFAGVSDQFKKVAKQKIIQLAL